MKIIDRLYRIPRMIGNVYLIVEPGGLTLIDAGAERRGKRILNYILRLGHTADELRRIVITHADGDHVGGVAGLKAVSGARVYASPIEAEAMAGGRMSRQMRLQGLQKALFAAASRFFKAEPAVADERVADRQVLPVLGGLRVVATPGHTPGHISLFAPSVGVLFSGDSVISRNGTLYPSRGANTWDEAQALESMRVQAALGARIVCPGHGPVVKGDELTASAWAGRSMQR